MRAPAALLALLLGGCGAGVPAALPRVARPVRVMSLNQCTDQLVLALLPPARIASVTWLSRDPRYSAQVVAARAVPANRGGLEEVVRTAPDLVVSDTFSNPAGRALLKRLGYPLVEVADAADLPSIRRNLRQLAAAVGERARGEALIARMDRELAPAAAATIPVAAWGRDGIGANPLLDLVLAAAGARRVAAGGDVEALLAGDPRFLVEGGAEAGQASLGDNLAGHPLVARRWSQARRLRVPAAYTICGTPALGTAATLLRAQLDRAS